MHFTDVYIIEEIPREKKPRYWALKTNLLYDAALVPNGALELYLGKQWSGVFNWVYAWWSKHPTNFYWRIYGGDIELRRWFGKKAEEKPLTGHHAGIYIQAATYDFEFGGRGEMGGVPGGSIWNRTNYGLGISYGYSLPITRRLNIDFGIGVGYFGGIYYKYIPQDGKYKWQSTNRRKYFGPTKLEVSLVWLLGHGNVNLGKGADHGR